MKTFTTSILVTIAFLSTQKAHAQQLHIDKVKHFAVGAAIGNGAELLTYKLTKNKNVALLAGIGSGMAVGVAKEIYDGRTGRGCCEMADAVWTGIGAAVGTLSFSFVIPQNPPKSTVTYH